MTALIAAADPAKEQKPEQGAIDDLKHSRTDRVTIVAAANRAVHEFVRIDPNKRRGNAIPLRLCGPAIRDLQPLRIQFDRMNLMIVLRETDSTEEGLYVSNPVSSYAPEPRRFAKLECLSQRSDQSFGSLYRYRIARRNKGE